MSDAVTMAVVVTAAAVAGAVDAIGGGGGLITLPALLAVGMPPQLAIGTNKGQAVFGAAASFGSFLHKGGIDRDRAPVGFIFGLAGSCIGARAVLAVRPEPLKPIVALLLLFAAVMTVVHTKLPPVRGRPAHPRLALAGVALGLGAYDGFFGPGVGSLLIVSFVVIFGDSLTRASGNAKVVNLASNLAALVIFAWQKVIVWQVALPMAVGNAIGAAFGARAAMARGDRLVRTMVLLVVGAAVAKLLVDMRHR